MNIITAFIIVISFIVMGSLSFCLFYILKYKDSFNRAMSYYADNRNYVPIDFKYFTDFYFVSPESYTLNDDFVAYKYTTTTTYFNYPCYERIRLFFPSFIDFVKYRSFVKKINKLNDAKKKEDISAAQSIATIKYLRKVQEDIDRLREGKD